MQLLLIMTLHVLISIALVALVLLQRGKGSEMGAAFGAGASGTMFGSQGATPFMVKLVAGLAIAFFCTSLGLNYMVSKAGNVPQQDILDLADPSVNQQSAPSNPAKLGDKGLSDTSQQMPKDKK